MADHSLPSIESIGLPLVYKASTEGDARVAEAETLNILVEARALEGMQKEAIVHHGPTNTTWRMVSDEGPYLNGTDLAPFPLAFYAVGMAFSLLSELGRHAEARGLTLRSIALEQDNFYTMQGSAIRGDMLGGALPTTIAVNVHSDASPEQFAELVRLAGASSPAQSYMADVQRNTFALVANGRAIPVEGVSACASDHYTDPTDRFESVQPGPAESYLREIIVKRSEAEAVHGVEGGAGSSLKSEQKRTLHVHTDARFRDDGLREAEVRLFKPIGSTFVFISDEAGADAPPSLAYLSAGVGFCYMTQLGRYATIVKQDLSSYRIVQGNTFKPGARAEARPVDTHVFVTVNDTDEAAQRLLRMGERTCFLHAAMRSSNPTKLSATLNGEPVALDRAEGEMR